MNRETSFETLPEAKSWCAIQTHSRCEKVVAQHLQHRGIPHYLPLMTRRNTSARSVRFFHVPLFPNYVFGDAGACSRADLFASRKVAQVLRPRDAEQLRAELCNLSIALQFDGALCQARFDEIGKPVRIVRGPLKGLSGEIVKISSQTKLIVRISFLGQAAELSIDEAFVEPDL